MKPKTADSPPNANARAIAQAIRDDPGGGGGLALLTWADTQEK